MFELEIVFINPCPRTIILIENKKKHLNYNAMYEKTTFYIFTKKLVFSMMREKTLFFLLINSGTNN